MKRSRIIPYLFLFILLLVGIFLAGVKYGHRIKQVNEVLEYLQNITPTPMPVTPTPQTNMTETTFETFNHLGCGISFLYPSNLTITQESSEEGTLQEKTNNAISISCVRNNLTPTLDPENETTEERTFKNRTITVQVNPDEAIDLISFDVRHPISGRTLSISLLERLYPLFERSLEYSQPVRATSTPGITE